MTADDEDLQESEASEIDVKKVRKPRSIRKKEIRNFRVQTELQDFCVVQDHHRQRRETSSKKRMLNSKKATKRLAKQKIRGP